MTENYGGYGTKAFGELITWLVKHAAPLYNRYLLHSGGQMPYRSIFEFAETRSYRPARQHLPEAESQWHYGIWLGRRTQGDERYNGTAEGVLRTRDIKPKSERYQADYLRKAPWRIRGRGQETDYPFFALPNPPIDVHSVPGGPLRRETDSQPPTATTDTSGERVAHLRRGLLPMTEAAAKKKGVRVPMATPHDETEKEL